MQFDGRCTVLFCPTAISIGIRRGFAAGGVQDSEYFGHGPARRFLPRPARHFFGDEIEKGDISGDVRADDGVADAS